MTDQPKVALVTGASRGIGARIAERLAADGLFVVGTATTDAGAAAIAERIGGGGQGARLDIADEQSVAALVERLADSPGMPSVLVNNAGVTRDNLLLRMSAADWQAVIDTNLTGLYRVTRPLLRSMIRARWGRIISLSSVVARMGNPGQANYAASKAGLIGMARSLAKEFASRNVTVNVVAPGAFSTDMLAALDEKQLGAIVERVPLGRVGDPDELAAAVEFLTSEDASYLTGIVLAVDGGLSMG